jgi:hypothetical protein
MYLHEKLGKARVVMYAAAVIVIVVVTLVRLIPRFH